MPFRVGESKNVEFKESLSLDMRTNSKARHIEDAEIKTIAAFLNSDGGSLLIGINDNETAVGIDEEMKRFYKSTDKLEGAESVEYVRNHFGKS